MNTETVYSARREADLVMTSIGQVRTITYLSGFGVKEDLTRKLSLFDVKAEYAKLK